MKILLSCVLLLVGCTAVVVETSPKPSVEASAVAVESSQPGSAATVADIATTTHTYFLVPSRTLIEAEYDNQRNKLENVGVAESQLRRMAFEDAVGMIGSMLDQKYGTHVQGEVLPCARMIIVKADQEIDMALLKDLVEEGP
jgi:hypothetical protein